jgi:sugar fermentation stimulation protein A
MNTLQLYDQWREVHYCNRPNRFVMNVNAPDGPTTVYVPNTGRMAEFRTRDASFFTTPIKSGKYAEKVIATRYQDAYVFLDTIKANDLFACLLKEGCFTEFQGFSSMQREVKAGSSRFDFCLFYPDAPPALIEIKSCTLVHNGVGMFPDAPTTRGLRHLTELDALTQYRTFVVFLVLNANGVCFFPNFHTHPAYGDAFTAAQHVQFRAYRVPFIDPVTCNASAVEQLPIAHEHLAVHNHDAGAYLLLLTNPYSQDITIGALGTRHFPAGWYIYAGSARNGLTARLARHQRKRKPLRWHIDYCASGQMQVVQSFPIRSQDALEHRLASDVQKIADDAISGFGASDSPLNSHFFYFTHDPRSSSSFWNILLSAMSATL